MTVIRVGIVGLSSEGWATETHVAALRALSDKYTLTALSTSRQSSAESAGKKFGVTAYFGGTEGISNDPAVDLVVISTKVPTHKEAVWPAIAAKKDVFVEWPLGRNLAEAREIAEYANALGVRTMVGLQARQSRALAKAKQLLREGKIGRVLSSFMVGSGGVWGAFVDQRNAYTTDRSNGATMLSIPLSHTLDAFSSLLGEFSWVNATLATQRTKIRVVESGEERLQTSPDQVIVQGELQTGAVVSIHYRGGSAASGGTDFLWEIEGETGNITFKGPSGHFQIFEPQLYLNGEELAFEGVDTLGNVGRQYQAFALRDDSGYVDFDHAVKRHELIDAIERSASGSVRVNVS